MKSHIHQNKSIVLDLYSINSTPLRHFITIFSKKYEVEVFTIIKIQCSNHKKNQNIEKITRNQYNHKILLNNLKLLIWSFNFLKGRRINDKKDSNQTQLISIIL